MTGICIDGTAYAQRFYTHPEPKPSSTHPSYLLRAVVGWVEEAQARLHRKDWNGGTMQVQSIGDAHACQRYTDRWDKRRRNNSNPQMAKT